MGHETGMRFKMTMPYGHLLVGDVIEISDRLCPWGCCWALDQKKSRGQEWVAKAMLARFAEAIPDSSVSPGSITAKHIGVALAVVAGLSIANHRRKKKVEHDRLEQAEQKK